MPITLLTLREAAKRYSLTIEQLHDLARRGKMKVVMLDSQEMVSDDEVRKVSGGNGNHVHWISLQDAAQQCDLDEALLERLAKDNTIRSGLLDNELQLVVDDVQTIAARLSKTNFQHLEGQPIEATQAANQYKLPYGSLLHWARQGHIRIIRQDRRPILLDEADVAYTSVLANIRGVTQGKALFPSSRQYTPPLPSWLR